jgi:hypothetical protein
MAQRRAMNFMNFILFLQLDDVATISGKNNMGP